MKITYRGIIGRDEKLLTQAFAKLPDSGLDVSVLTPIRIVASHPDTGVVITVLGTNMKFINDDPDQGVSGGTVTGLSFVKSGITKAVFESFSWDFADFVAAIDGFDANPASFDSLINSEEIEFDGSGAPAAILMKKFDFNLTNSLTVLGSDGDDRLFGGAFTDTIKGGDGNDIIRGGESKDFLHGGTQIDTLYGDAGRDRIHGGSSRDTLYGGQGNDRLFGGKGTDTVNGGAGNDMVKGGGSADELHGNGGNDLIFGDMGSDLLNGGKGSDTMFGGGGTDDLFGGKGIDALHGGAGVDVLYGGGGNDSLFGGDDLDSLRGGGGNDTLFGGAGTDDMSGGTGADVFIFNNNATNGADIINDFQSGEDLIRITDGYSFADLTIVSSGVDDVNTTITWGATEVLLFNVDRDAIDASDFDFL